MRIDRTFAVHPGSASFDLDEIQRFERINVVGTSGSGKTALARECAKSLGLPFVEMDQLFWKANWEESTDDEFCAKLRAVTDGPRWVLDGNYSRTISIKWQRAQWVIWLDLPFALTVLRVTRRAIIRSLTHQEIWPDTGNRETLTNSSCSRDSVIWWAITSYNKNRKQYAELMSSSDYSHLCFVRLRKRTEVRTFRSALRRGHTNSDPG